MNTAKEEKKAGKMEAARMSQNRRQSPRLCLLSAIFFLASLATLQCGRFDVQSFGRSRVDVQSFGRSLMASPRTAAAKTMTRCYALDKERTSLDLSNGTSGIVYRLGRYALPPNMYRSGGNGGGVGDNADGVVVSRSIILDGVDVGSGRGRGRYDHVTWDVLYDDHRGAFDVPLLLPLSAEPEEKWSNATAAIVAHVWRDPHNVLFFAYYHDPSGNADEAEALRAYLMETVVVSNETHPPPPFAHYDGSDAIVVGCPEVVLSAKSPSSSSPQFHSSSSSPLSRLLPLPPPSSTSYLHERPPSRPFYRTRSDTSGVVTACTQLTIDRLPQLELLARTYGGPISAVVYLGFRHDDEMGANMEFDELTRAYDASDAMRKHVDLHIARRVVDGPWYAVGTSEAVHGTDPYPINLLRQWSVDWSRTDWVLYVEADMSTPFGMHSLLLDRWNDMIAEWNVKSRRAVFVVPCYAYWPSRLPPDPRGALERGGAELDAKGGVRLRSGGRSNVEAVMRAMPRNKTDLVQYASSFPSAVERMGKMYVSHGWLQYEEWEKSFPATTDVGTDAAAAPSRPVFLPYGEDKWTISKHYQEPYFVAHKSDIPPYDVLYWGMPRDKVMHVRDVFDCGFEFIVHPDVYVLNFMEKPEQENATAGPGNNGGDGDGNGADWGTWTTEQKVHSTTWRWDWVHEVHSIYRDEAQMIRRAVFARKTDGTSDMEKVGAGGGKVAEEEVLCKLGS